MPIEHYVDVLKNTLRVRRWGHITTHDEVDAQRQRDIDPLVLPGIKVLVDCTKVEPSDSRETISYLTDNISQTAKTLLCGPVSIVVSTDIEFGMARMYMGQTSLVHPNTNVFKSEGEAIAWLELQG